MTVTTAPGTIVLHFLWCVLVCLCVRVHTCLCTHQEVGVRGFPGKALSLSPGKKKLIVRIGDEPFWKSKHPLSGPAQSLPSHVEPPGEGAPHLLLPHLPHISRRSLSRTMSLRASGESCTSSQHRPAPSAEGRASTPPSQPTSHFTPEV